MAKVDYFFENKEAIQSLSKEIGERFINDANDENVDYSFDIAKGTGKLKTKTPNTSFYFDTNKGSTLDSLKKALFDEDLVSIEQDTPEEKVLSPEDHVNITFHDGIADAIIKNKENKGSDHE